MFCINPYNFSEINLLFLRIFYLFSENLLFGVEKCKIFALYFQWFTKNVTKKCNFLEKLAWRSILFLVKSSAHRHGEARKAERLEWAARSKAGRGSFQVYWLSEMLGWVERFATGYNLPGGASERIKRGKEKVVTRAVAYAEMKPCGVSERWLHGTDELKKVHWSSNFLKYIMESLILAQNERWRRG